MNKLFYPKLAATNIKKNSKTYLPYVITCICTIMMFYIMHSISINEGLDKVSGSASLKSVLALGTIVIGIFSTIFLFYTNSFLIKRRKKEIGLYNILGLEKKHIAKMLFFENFFISLVSLLLGLIGGIILSKLIFLSLLRLLNFAVPFGFSISLPSLQVTLIVFVGIFIVTLLSNLFQIQIANPIELLKGGQHGEKEPKTKWIMTIVGIITLGAGYTIALTVKSPLSALFLFFIAVILVMLGTYALFTAGSIALLKLLRKNKNFYYKTKNFSSVSGMLYRMKQNAVGLANICILSTAVLVMLSTTVSLYFGMEDVLRTRYPRNIIINAKGISDVQTEQLNHIIKTETEKINVTVNSKISYRSMSLMAIQDKSSFSGKHNGTYSDSNMANVICIPLDEYNKMQNQSAELKQGEILLYSMRGSIPDDTVQLGKLQLKVKERINDLNVDGKMSAMLMNSYFFIVPDVKTIESMYLSLAENPGNMGGLSYYCGFDVDAGAETQIVLTNAVKNRIEKSEIDAYVEGAENSRESFYSLYGGLFFLGIFLGALFLMATVLIIYYKQISEGYDDKERFEIMQKVGMSKSEIRKTIKSQILMMFFLPLIAAVVHIAFAFPIITKLLAVLNLTNVSLFMLATLITILVFAIIYGIVFSLTAKIYYRIVE